MKKFYLLLFVFCNLNSMDHSSNSNHENNNASQHFFKGCLEGAFLPVIATGTGVMAAGEFMFFGDADTTKKHTGNYISSLSRRDAIHKGGMASIYFASAAFWLLKKRLRR